jgi:RES domain
MAEPLLYEWQRSISWYRCHKSTFTENAFNGSGGGDTRFSPLRSLTGATVPTLYAGETIECAYMETVLHDLPIDLSGHILDLDDLEGRVISQIAPTRTLKLIDLTTTGLRRLGLQKSKVIETTPLQYAETRVLAERLHASFPEVDGLRWISRQYDESSACVLFGDRVVKSDLQVTAPMASIFTADALSALLRLGHRLGIRAIYAKSTGTASFAELMNHARIVP